MKAGFGLGLGAGQALGPPAPKGYAELTILSGQDGSNWGVNSAWVTPGSINSDPDATGITHIYTEDAVSAGTTYAKMHVVAGSDIFGTNGISVLIPSTPTSLTYLARTGVGTYASDGETGGNSAGVWAFVLSLIGVGGPSTHTIQPI